MTDENEAEPNKRLKSVGSMVAGIAGCGLMMFVSEAIRNAAWKAFAEDPAAELRAVFSALDESPDTAAPDSAAIAAEVRAWRARR